MLISQITEHLTAARKAKLLATKSEGAFDAVHNEILRNLLTTLLAEIKIVGTKATAMLPKPIEEGEEVDPTVERELTEQIVPRETTEAEALEVVAKFAKNIQNNIERMVKAGLDVSKDQAELNILLGYLPQQMDDIAVEAALVKAFEDGLAKNIGAVMAHMKANFDGLYNGKSVAGIANKLIKG